MIMGTTQVKRKKEYFPLRVALVDQPGLMHDTDLLIDQVRAISNRRFMGLQPMTMLSSNHLKRVEDALKLLIGR
jgi:mRNA interferase MazF